MLRRHLYLRITAIIVASLFLFSFAAAALWGVIGYDDYGDELYAKSARLAERLLPPAEASEAALLDSVIAVSEMMDYEITIYDADRSLLAASHMPVTIGAQDIAIGTWSASHARRQWATQLEDGRIAVIVLDRARLPDETITFTIFLLILALTVSLMMYPIARNVTKRLERLQQSVEQMGSGVLGARVEVEGDDEVAAVAMSFNKTADQLERLVDSQRLLLAHASHELRTPLARIRMGIELLKSEQDPERRASIEHDISELDALIEELLLLSRLDAPAQASELEPVDLTALAAVECARYPNAMLEADTIDQIQGDARMLQHLLRNLIDNALTHGKPPVTVKLTSDDASIILIVSDGGSGISEDDRLHIFEPFYRAPGQQNVPGFGLGLALVKRIADSHSAVIELAPLPVSAISVVFPKS